MVKMKWLLSLSGEWTTEGRYTCASEFSQTCRCSKFDVSGRTTDIVLYLFSLLLNLLQFKPQRPAKIMSSLPSKFRSSMQSGHVFFLFLLQKMCNMLVYRVIRFIFCMFTWPYVAKWRNSEIKTNGMLYINVYFPWCIYCITRVGNLFRARQQKAAPISLVKLTEEFNMQVRIWLHRNE